MPERVWDVEDDRKLRSALGSTERFASDGYHRLWIGAGSGYTTGALSKFATLAAWELDDSSTEEIDISFIKPEHWKRGVLRPRWHLIAETGGGTSKVQLQHTQRSWSFTVTGSDGAPTILDVTETFTFDATGAFDRDIYEPTGWDTKQDTDLFEVFGIRLRRIGGDGSDDIIGDLNVVGLELIFIPDPTP